MTNIQISSLIIFAQRKNKLIIITNPPIKHKEKPYTSILKLSSQTNHSTIIPINETYIIFIVITAHLILDIPFDEHILYVNEYPPLPFIIYNNRWNQRHPKP